VAAGDDYVWVQEHVAVSSFRTVKTRHSSQLVPMSVTTALPGFDMNYDEPKRVHYLADRPEAMTRHLPLVAAVVVRQGASETAWRSIPRVEAFLHAAPSSLFQASADHEQQLAAISALLAALPCFELAVSDDLNDVGSGVLRLVDSLLGEPPT
jgi:hypothetical protein